MHKNQIIAIVYGTFVVLVALYCSYNALTLPIGSCNEVSSATTELRILTMVLIALITTSAFMFLFKISKLVPKFTEQQEEKLINYFSGMPENYGLQEMAKLEKNLKRKLPKSVKQKIQWENSEEKKFM